VISRPGCPAAVAATNEVCSVRLLSLSPSSSATVQAASASAEKNDQPDHQPTRCDAANGAADDGRRIGA